MAADLTIPPRADGSERPRSVPSFVVAARMRLALIRRGLRDPNLAAWVYLGAVVGLVLAAGTIWVAAAYPRLLAPVLGLWWLGWIVGPVVTGRGESLRPDYFTAIGLNRRRLAMTLLGGSLTGFGPMISLVAVTGLAVVGFRAGWVSGVVSIVAGLLTVLLFVSTSNLISALYGLLVRVPIGAALAGVITGFVLAFAAQGWALVAAFVSDDLAAVLGQVARMLPSGWGVVAIEALAVPTPFEAGLALVGMLMLIMVAVAAWVWLLGRRTVRNAFRVRPRRLLRGHDSGSAARAKELRSVLRDPLQINRLVFALSYGLSFCLMPVALGWTGMVPWAAPVFVVMAASAMANLYGSDGTVLWQLIIIPGAALQDVRARQRTFLIMTVPAAVLVTLVAMLFVDEPGQWPYVIATLPAVLGAGAGLIVLVSVYVPAPGTDPHKRTANPLDTGAEASATGTMYLAMFAVLIAAAPAILAVLLIGWWGVLIGVLTGLICWYQFGRLAGRRLDRSGPELLELLRRGHPIGGAGPGTATTAVLDTLPKLRRRLVIICLTLGAIPLFPQGILPLAFLISGNPTRAWFLARYLPTPVNWIVAIAMIILGLTMYTYGSVVYAGARRRNRPEAAV